MGQSFLMLEIWDRGCDAATENTQIPFRNPHKDAGCIRFTPSGGAARSFGKNFLKIYE
jgi:hypothetical protein